MQPQNLTTRDQILYTNLKVLGLMINQSTKLIVSHVHAKASLLPVRFKQTVQGT